MFSWFSYQIQSRVASSIYTKYTEQTRMFSVVWQAWNVQLSSLVCISACLGLMLFMSSVVTAKGDWKKKSILYREYNTQ